MSDQQDHDPRPALKSLSAPATPTEGSRDPKLSARRVTFPADDMLVTGYLEPPCPWKSVDSLTSDELEVAYRTSCEKFNIIPIPKVQEQLREIRCFDIKHDCLSLKGERIDWEQCEALEEIFKRVQFHTIDLEDSGLCDESAVALFDMIEYYESAEVLNISHNRNILSRGWQACSRMIKKASGLVELQARDTNLTEQFMPIIGRTLRSGSSLACLHLEHCCITGRTLTGLMMSLRQNTSVKELYLGGNKLTANDALQIGNLIRANFRLQLLDLSNNSLMDVGASHIAESLCEQQPPIGAGLTGLVLTNNKLTFNSTPPISRMLLTTRSLKKLGIGQNNITNEGVHCIREGLMKNRTLVYLGLNSAQVTCEGAVALAEYIADSPMIMQLDLKENEIRVGGLLALSLSMKVNTTVTSIHLNTEPLTDQTAELQDQYVDLFKEIQGYCTRNNNSAQERSQVEAKLKTNNEGLSESVNRLLSLWSHVPTDGTTTPPPKINQDQITTKTLRAKRGLQPQTLLPPSFYSPLPSPVPSPTRSRFRVSKVILEGESSSSADDSPVEAHCKGDTSDESETEKESHIQKPTPIPRIAINEARSRFFVMPVSNYSTNFSSTIKPTETNQTEKAKSSDSTTTTIAENDGQSLTGAPITVQTPPLASTDNCDNVPDISKNRFLKTAESSNITQTVSGNNNLATIQNVLPEQTDKTSDESSVNKYSANLAQPNLSQTGLGHQYGALNVVGRFSVRKSHSVPPDHVISTSKCCELVEDKNTQHSACGKDDLNKDSDKAATNIKTEEQNTPFITRNPAIKCVSRFSSRFSISPVPDNRVGSSISSSNLADETIPTINLNSAVEKYGRANDSIENLITIDDFTEEQKNLEADEIPSPDSLTPQYPLFVQLRELPNSPTPLDCDPLSNDAVDDLKDFMTPIDQSFNLQGDCDDLIDLGEKTNKTTAFNCEEVVNGTIYEECDKRKSDSFSSKGISIPYLGRTNLSSISSSLGSDSAYSGSPTSLEECTPFPLLQDDSSLSSKLSSLSDDLVDAAPVVAAGFGPKTVSTSQRVPVVFYPVSEIAVLSTYPPRRLHHPMLPDGDGIPRGSPGHMLGINLDLALLEGLNLKSSVPLSPAQLLEYRGKNRLPSKSRCQYPSSKTPMCNVSSLTVSPQPAANNTLCNTPTLAVSALLTAMSFRTISFLLLRCVACFCLLHKLL